jgi:hypothetical protein
MEFDAVRRPVPFCCLCPSELQVGIQFPSFIGVSAANFHVGAVVGAALDKLKIVDVVVAPIVILVMDAHALWYRAIMLNPNPAMQKPLAVNLDS